MDGQGFRSPASDHVDSFPAKSFTAKAHGHVPDGAVVISDPNLIFHGDFKRTGLDLVLSHDGHDVVVSDYFRGDKRAAIASPDGAHLTGDIVSALTGYVQVAQTAPGAAAAQVIGHVTKLTGSATVVRNGVSVILNNGDNVEKGDVVSTGSDSTLGITFIDGTVFGLSSNARMVLNEMVYDPNGSNNSSLLSLVAGTITFVAGETAKHGDMKIDTPVATMGIRGTAVLTEINFVVPSGGGDPQPQANFQVLVEPNGTTGSYILFDKLTLLPIATVNQAGQMIQISGGNVSVTNALLSPDVQKLITDVFTLKFTDNNTNTKLTTNFTDSITQNGNTVVVKTDSGATATATFANTGNSNGTGPSQNAANKGADRIPGPPDARVLDATGNVTSSFPLKEHADATADHLYATGSPVGPDTIIFRVNFVDQNVGDRPTVSVDLAEAPNYAYTDAGHHDVTGSLSALQKQDIAATQVQISVAADAGNNNNGSATLTYTVPDHAFDFLADGETLTLTYKVLVNDNFAVQPEATAILITITVTGTNDKPVITTSVPTITFSGGTSVPGGPLTTKVPTSGTLTFKDVDLTDTHTASVALTSATLPDGTSVPPGPLAAFQSAMSVAIASGLDSTGTGTGTINWSLADLPVYLADFIPKGEVLTLVYTVTVADEHSATSQQTITVTIAGTDAPAVVWIATNKEGAPAGGFWKDAANWETGTVPTSADDVIVITDQLHGLTPSYPVTIDVAAYGKSLTMDDYDTTAHHTTPQVINHSTLTLAGKLTLNADAKFTNAADGQVLVGGAIDVETITRPKTDVVVTNTATIINAGTLTLEAGGVIDTLTTIVNSGNFNLSGGTLMLDTGIANGGGTVRVGSGATLVANAVTIDGGTVNVSGTLELDGANLIENGTLSNSGTVNVKGTTEFASETVANKAGGNIIVDAALTLNEATLSGGAIKGGGSIDVTGASKIDEGATLTVATVTADAKLTLDGITVSGSVITDNASIELDNTVKLQDSAKIQGGPVTNNGTLEIAGAATLLNDVVTNNGTVRVDDGKILTLSGTEISGGTINNYSGLLGGTIDVIGDSTIDGNATLNQGAVTVASDITLTFDDATVSASKITNNGTVRVEADKKLTLAGATLTGGALTIAGTLASSGTTTVTDASISNSYLLESTLGGLLTLVATTSTPAITNDGGTIRANNAELDINTEAVTNTGTLAAINDGTLKLISMAVTNTGGKVSVESGSTLDLTGASIDGGTVTIAGLLESTGTSTINNGDITNTGTIVVTSGTLTIDPAIVQHTITNSHLLQANGGELDISGDLVINTADLKAIGGGILRLSKVTVTNDGGTVTVDGTSKLYLSNASAINGGQLSNAGHLYGVSGGNGIAAAITNTGTIEVQTGTLNLSGGLTGAGSLIIDDSATLKLAGATAQTVTFAGGADTLQLDKVAGQSFTGTITGQSSKGGTFTIKGAADITASSGDALDFTAAGSTLAKPANVVLTPTGALKGAASGVVVTQKGTGDISLTATKDITGLVGNGITLRDSVTGAGNITVYNLSGKATGTGANSEGILVENLNAANAGDISITQLGGASGGAYGIDATTWGDGKVTIDAGGTITGSSIYGIRARSYGTGSETVTTKAGSVVTSGSSGIVAVNRAISLDASEDSKITVNAYGTINSGSSLSQSGNTPAGIQAGYTGATIDSAANPDVNGSVVVNNYANITSGGHGIHAFNYGNGDVTVNDGAGITVIGAVAGIKATAVGGGTGDVSVNIGANAHIKGTSGYGIDAYSLNAGNISVVMSDGDVVQSGSVGIDAVNEAAVIGSDSHSTIFVSAHGTIHSGATNTPSNHAPAGIMAGYTGGGGNFDGAVHGDVTVESDATITTDAGAGIAAFTQGVGTVTVTTGEDSSITAAGTAINVFDLGGGDINVTNEGSATGATGLAAFGNGAGKITIANDGHITGTSGVGIGVTQAANATGQVHITNDADGHVTGAGGLAAISVDAGSLATVLIDNSGTIGPDAAGSVTSTTYAIFESGGHLTINNSGDINGNISVATATFNNEADGIWTVSGTSVFGSLSSIVNDGVIDLLNGASIFGAGLGINSSNEIDSWGTASISGTITNTGTIEVNTGTLSLFGSLSGAGSVTLDANATLDVNATVAQTITFNGGGAELRVDTSSFGGAVAGFASTDKLDLSTIKFDGGTFATYDSETGDLVVSDAYGDSITVKLIGADYSNAHFAGSSDGHGGTLVTLNAADDAPAFNAAEASPSVSFAELDSKTGAATMDPASGGTGTIHFTDIDLTERPTAKITHQDTTWLAADHTTALTLTPDEISAFENALSLQQTGKNNGAVSWSYSIADSTLDFLGQGQTATVVSTITLDDHRLGTDTAQVTVAISGANDAPTVADVNAGTLTDTAAADTFPDLTGQLVGTDVDTGETATLTYAVLDAKNNATTTVAGHYGALTVHSDGSYDYVSDATAINALPAGPYTDTFTVQTTDVHGATGTATFTVDVTGANDTPILANGSLGKLTDTAATDSFPNLVGQFAGTDADSGETATLTYAVLDGHHQPASVATGLYGSLTVNANGTYTYVPDAASINALPKDSYSDAFTVQVTDVHGAATTATYTVDVTGANDAPTLANLNIGTLTDTAATDSFSNLTGKLAGVDADSDETATLSYAVLDTAHHEATTVSGLYGSLTVGADGSYTYVPNAAAINALSAGNYTDNFTVETKDVHGATGTATLTVGVTGANDAPVINVDNISVTQQDDERILVHGLKITDADAAPGETFTLLASTAQPGSNVSPSSGSGALAGINTTLGTVTYNEGSGEPATDKVALKVTDGHGATDTLNLIFNLREEGSRSNVALIGTTGKDVFFGTAGHDQFVFGANANHDTIVNFTSGSDHVDLTAVVTTSNISDWMAQHVSVSPMNSADTLITIDAADTIVLKGVTHLSASDILHA